MRTVEQQEADQQRLARGSDHDERDGAPPERETAPDGTGSRPVSQSDAHAARRLSPSVPSRSRIIGTYLRTVVFPFERSAVPVCVHDIRESNHTMLGLLTS